MKDPLKNPPGEGIMSEDHRILAGEIAKIHLNAGDPLGWFEALYSRAIEKPEIIPWADLEPNPNLIEWLDRHGIKGPGRALKIGSGLGDDAEELARRNFQTTAFDISETAVAWSQRRFPQSSVVYTVANVLQSPIEWETAFDFVLESYTLQVLPYDLRAEAIRSIASFVAPGGTLLIIARGKDPGEPDGTMPWPLTKDELALFVNHGLTEVAFEDYMDSETPPVRRFRASYRREQ